MRNLRFLLLLLCFVVPVLLLGCEGDDGAAGAPGAAGDPGDPGPGALANETCVLCHGEGKIADVAAEHDTTTGTVTAMITGAQISAVDNASVTFTFAATDADGVPVVVDLTEPGTGNLLYLRFTIARLVPGAGTGDPDQWEFYGPRSHRNAAQLVNNGGGNYTFTFDNTVLLDPAEAGFTHRVGFELNITNFPAEARLRSVNPTFDFVPDGGAMTTREIVTTVACNQCHDPLGVTPSFHGSRRVETQYCVLCHNTNNDLAGFGPIPFLSMVHMIHRGDSLDEHREDHGLTPLAPAVIAGEDFSEVTYPQDLRNCTKCHQGGTDSDNWKERPSREACGACHGIDIFDTGVGHQGGQQLTNAGCTLCHPADVDGVAPAISKSHRTENVTPNNPDLPAGLSKFEYFIDNVAVDNTGVATVGFRITQDNVVVDLSTGAWPPPSNTATPIADTNGPSFLLAWALPQDGIDTPAEYNNRNSPAPPSSSNGNGAGDAPSVSLKSLVTDNLVTASGAGFTALLSSRPFPAGATIRAVALQAYFTQDTGTDNVGRHTPSVMAPVPGDAVRRQVVKSGIDSVTGEPFGCLECHEILELHGGSRVNNPQVCVFCHNANKSSSGRTVNPANINPDVVAAVGSDPLLYPEATNNLKELVHGIHAATDRPYEFVRNRVNGFYFNWSEVTFPGDLMDCTKCHIGDSFVPSNVPADTLWTTERITTGDPAETRADIIAARGSVPNLTDLVNSPIASACYYCHDDGTSKSHILLQGGQLGITREDALGLP